MTVTRIRNPAVKRDTRSESGESTFNVLLYVKCIKIAERMLRGMRILLNRAGCLGSVDDQSLAYRFLRNGVDFINEIKQ